MILKRTCKNHEKILITVWEHFKSLREKDNRLLKIVKQIDHKAEQVKRISFILYLIVITIKFNSQTVSFLRSSAVSLIESLLHIRHFDHKSSQLSMLYDHLIICLVNLMTKRKLSTV